MIVGHLGLRKIKHSQGRVTGAGLGITGLIFGYLCLLVFIGIWSLIFASYKHSKHGEAAAATLFDLSTNSIPSMPARPVFQEIEDTGVTVSAVKFTSGNGPGHSMEAWIYLPAGQHARGSLKAVLVAPAGTNLLSGASLGPLTDDAYHSECLPYAEAGMAVVMYSLDGPVTDTDPDNTDAQTVAYQAFVDSNAGLLNARNALEYIIYELPEVDPSQIYSAGHSSAGTLSLLFGEHEKRLAGVLAYAPASDVEARLGEVAKSPFSALIYPNLSNFIKRSSPKTHAAEITHPVFLFHAEDDSNVPVSETREFAELLRANGRDVTLQIIPDGGHYDSMIQVGIPAGIEWIRQH